MDYIVFGQPKLGEEEINAVAETLRSGWIGTGPKAKEFELAFARYQGSRHAAAVSSCTAALTLSLRALGINPGDEVITTALTFAATVNAIISVGATPVIVDIERHSKLIDLDKVEAAITPRTRAIIPVHFAGAPVDIDRLLDLRARYGLKIVHDCAHAIETEWQGRLIGSAADATCYSFYSTKNITTIEGGMVCSDDDVFIEKVRLLSYQGMSKDAWKRYSNHGYNHYDIVSQGFKLNFTDVQASLGLCQLATIEQRHQRRKAVWDRYQKALADLPIELPAELPKGHRHAYHLYTILLEPTRAGIERDEMLTRLHSSGIGCGVHYRSLPSMSHYQEIYGWKAADYPHAYRVGESTLSLPLTPYLNDQQIERVISTVREIILHSVAHAPLAA